MASQLIAGVRAEQIRVRADTRDGKPVVRLDLLEPVADGAVAVVGPGLTVPLAKVAALVAAIEAASAQACAPRERPGRPIIAPTRTVPGCSLPAQGEDSF
jgi:hypothetical protein